VAYNRDQPRWPKGTPRKGKAGGGQWREDGKPNAPRPSWAERMGSIIGRRRRGDQTPQDPDRERQIQIRRRYGMPDDASADEIGTRIRQAGTTQTHMRPGESAQEYGERLGAAVAASPYWTPGPDPYEPQPDLTGLGDDELEALVADDRPPAGDFADQISQRIGRRRGEGRPTADSVTDAVLGMRGSSRDEVDEMMDRQFGDTDLAELGRIREGLAAGNQLYDRTIVRAIDRLMGRRTGNPPNRGTARLESLRDRMGELRQAGTGNAVEVLADSLADVSLADLRDMQDRLEEQHRADARLYDELLDRAIRRAIRNARGR